MPSKHKRQEQFNYFTLWIVQHVRAGTVGFGELIRAPLASIMTIAVIGIALALPAAFYLLLQNFQHISEGWNNTPSISLYLKQDTPPEQASQLVSTIKKEPDIAAVKYISPEQGLEDFKQTTQFDDLLASLKTNPLPGVMVVTPTKNHQSPVELQHLLAHLKTLSPVDLAQLDMAWVNRLFYFITIGNRIVYTLTLLFGIGVILVVGNTIRLTTQSHQEEISVLKLVGATNAFIRRPLLYRGLMIGLFGGFLAWLLVSLMLWWLATPAKHLAQTYGASFSIDGLNATTGLKILLIAASLGILGSWVAMRKHLTAPESL